LHLVYLDGRERCADRLDRLLEDVRAWIESVRRSRGRDRQGSSTAGVQAQTPAQQSVRVEDGRIVVEREVELETVRDIKRIALDPRVCILYAYTQKYLGYPGSLGNLFQTAQYLFFQG
jgi:hypothetical protein